MEHLLFAQGEDLLKECLDTMFFCRNSLIFQWASKECVVNIEKFGQSSRLGTCPTPTQDD